jgi:hypothetical protein
MKTFLGAMILAMATAAPASALTFVPLNEQFEQLANGDLKVSGEFRQTNRRGVDYDLKITIEVWENDLDLGTGLADDYLGMFMFSLWIDADPSVLPMVKNVSANGMATPKQVLGLSVDYMFTIKNGVALGGGASDNSYYTEATVVEVDTVPVPASIAFMLTAAGLLVVGGRRPRRRGAIGA